MSSKYFILICQIQWIYYLHLISKDLYFEFVPINLSLKVIEVPLYSQRLYRTHLSYFPIHSTSIPIFRWNCSFIRKKWLNSSNTYNRRALERSDKKHIRNVFRSSLKCSPLFKFNRWTISICLLEEACYESENKINGRVWFSVGIEDI